MSLLAQNRSAFHDFEVLEKLEAGIALHGTEVKSCRAHDVSLAEAYAEAREGDLWLVNAHIAPYACGNRQNHEPRRARRLLVHRREIIRLARAIEAKGMTLIPLRVYLVKGKVKVELGLCRGKNTYDKRESLKKKTQDQELRRALKK